MINKKIHYCWLSSDPLPRSVIECMDTWRRALPDYELVRWDGSNDIASVDFVSQACSRKKWAFASDYIRLYAVHQHGGFYLDSNVRVLKSFNPLLSAEMIIPVEYHPGSESAARLLLDSNFRPRNASDYIPSIGLRAAIFGSRRGHPFLRKCMDFYEATQFINQDGTVFTSTIAPAIYAKIADRFGFIYNNRSQLLMRNMDVTESRYFASTADLATNDAFAVHCCNGSWKQPTTRSILKRAVFWTLPEMKAAAFGRGQTRQSPRNVGTSGALPLG